MTLYSAETLDLSRIDPAPLVAVDYESTLAARLALLLEIWDEHRAKNPALPAIDTTMLESEPVVIENEAFAFAETLILQMINDAAKQLRLAQASGAALEHLTTTFHRTQRQMLVPATAQTPAIYESDDALRLRAQMEPESLAEFGLTPGGYVYRVKTAFADRIKDVRPINRGDGRIELRVLGRDSDGTVPPATIAEIAAAFRPEDASQSTDVLTVLSAEIDHQDWTVTQVIRRGPDAAAVAAAGKAQLELLAADLHRIGADVFREALSTAGHVGPVITVRVDSPVADRDGRAEVAPYVDSITVLSEVR